MKKLLIGMLFGLVLGTGIMVVEANGHTFDASSGQSAAYVEGCPDGYICVTLEEYEAHWEVCLATQ